ncbi:MAG: alanyl-tRNA editing protein [Deltaproteobacteria bacterium]|nr:alanyl-tRNA editing protein [Deltaproteobacteria bacterium]MDQ3299056.1 alanine--tRNA ligase-related protein [Myxococcota bacterium]
MTRRLYHDDAYLRRFEAEVVALASWKGKPAAILDHTAFYPEAGGQLGDRGTLAGATVIDTQELDGAIVHVLDGEAPAIGTIVTGELDWARRRQHMAQHTAQHLLSGTLLERATAPTVSARLGESSLTIDLTRDRIPDAEVAAAEDLANDLIDDDLAIRAWFPSADELAQLDLRRDPKVDANIRVVAIGDYDFSPCGGTHCARTSQLAAIRITNTERYKGMTRVTFTTARRGRGELFTRDQVLRGLASTFSCGPAEVPAAVDKLRRDAEAAGTEIANLRSRLATAIIAQLTGTGAAIVAVPADAELLRSVAAKLVASGRDAILCAPEPEGGHVVLFRAAGSQLDCGALWKQIAARAGGRGGGKPDRAEGRLTMPVADWPALIDELWPSTQPSA